MFGHAFLYAPILEDEQYSRRVYLPPYVKGWTHVWSGEKFKGGQLLTVEAPYGKMPLFVKGGEDESEGVVEFLHYVDGVKGFKM